MGMLYLYVGKFWLSAKLKEGFQNKCIINNHDLCNCFPVTNFFQLYFATSPKPWRICASEPKVQEQIDSLNLKISPGFLAVECRAAAETAVQSGELQQHVY
jgi:hypothetical protein